MRRKLAFLVAVFCATVLAMAVQKPVFMAWYAAEAAGAGFGGWMAGSGNSSCNDFYMD